MVKTLKQQFAGLLIVFAAVSLSGCSQSAGVYTPAITKLTERADSLHAAGNLQEAISRMNAAADLDPDSAAVHYNLGVLYSEKKDWPQAIVHLEKSLTLSPKQPNALFTLAFTYESQFDDMTDATKLKAPKGAKPAPSSEAQSYKEKALATYEDYLKQAPPNDPHRQEAEAAVESLRHS